MPEPRKLRVFLCHSSHDKPAVRELYQRLKNEGWIDPWLDEEKLYPGQDWDLEIEKAVEAVDAVLVFLSDNSVSKEGYIQKELRIVLNMAEYKPEGEIFILPLRLNKCPLPRRLVSWHYVDNFPEERKEWAYRRLLGSLKIRAKKVGVDVAAILKEKEAREAVEKAEQEPITKEKREAEEKARLEKEATDKAIKEKAEEASRLQYEVMWAQERGDYDEAEKFLRRSLQIAVDLNDEQGRSSIQNQLLELNQNRLNKEQMEREAAKNADQERKEHERLEREASVRKEKAEEARWFYNEGLDAQERGNYDEAEKFFRQSLQIAVDLNDEQGRSSIQNQLVKLNQDRLKKEQMEREAAEEKAEQERKKRERLEREEKARKVKDAAEKAAREKAQREAEERAKKEKEIRERKEREEKILRSPKITIGEMEFLRVPKGKFIMGDKEEKHEVDIPYDYFLARFQVTNQLFKKFADASYFSKDWGVSKWNEKLDHPIVNVSWRTAQAYCQWLNQQWRTDLPSGLIFRLPTEAEWEKAARSTDGRMWPWGDEFDNNKCNSAKNIGVGLINIIGSHTTPIGK